MTVMKEAANRWFVSFSFELPVILNTPSDEPRDCIGIDLGCLDLYYASDTSQVEATRHFRAALAHLKKLQRRFSKAEKYTDRWYRLLRALGKAHAKVRRKRHDFLHNEANKLLDRTDVVVVRGPEDCQHDPASEAQARRERRVSPQWRQGQEWAQQIHSRRGLGNLCADAALQGD
jgi:putative transposase